MYHRNTGLHALICMTQVLHFETGIGTPWARDIGNEIAKDKTKGQTKATVAGPGEKGHENSWMGGDSGADEEVVEQNSLSTSNSGWEKLEERTYCSREPRVNLAIQNWPTPQQNF